MRRTTGGPVMLAIVTAVTAVTGLLVGTLLGLRLPNPFGTEEVDRSPAVLLRSIEDLSRYQAASASFQVIVDLERDVKFVPSALAGERALFLAQGSVDGYVDFSGLGADAIAVSDDRRSVTVTLPPAGISKPRLDTEESRVISRSRGVLDRLGGVFSDNPTSEQELYVKAEERLRRAAAESDLRKRTEENTRTMLTGLLRGLGYEDVTVRFEPDRRP
jgi:hypothetical protein